MRYADYLQYNTFLADINNERANVTNPAYAAAMAGLGKVLLIDGSMDRIVVPWVECMRVAGVHVTLTARCQDVSRLSDVSHRRHQYHGSLFAITSVYPESHWAQGKSPLPLSRVVSFTARTDALRSRRPQDDLRALWSPGHQMVPLSCAHLICTQNMPRDVCKQYVWPLMKPYLVA